MGKLDDYINSTGYTSDVVQSNDKVMNNLTQEEADNLLEGEGDLVNPFVLEEVASETQNAFSLDNLGESISNNVEIIGSTISDIKDAILDNTSVVVEAFEDFVDDIGDGIHNAFSNTPGDWMD